MAQTPPFFFDAKIAITSTAPETSLFTALCEVPKMPPFHEPSCFTLLWALPTVILDFFSPLRAQNLEKTRSSGPRRGVRWTPEPHIPRPPPYRICPEKGPRNPPGDCFLEKFLWAPLVDLPICPILPPAGGAGVFSGHRARGRRILPLASTDLGHVSPGCFTLRSFCVKL